MKLNRLRKVADRVVRSQSGMLPGQIAAFVSGRIQHCTTLGCSDKQLKPFRLVIVRINRHNFTNLAGKLKLCVNLIAQEKIFDTL